MPISQSPLAHSDIQAVMDRALENGRGVRIRISTPGEGYSIRQRCYTMRLLDRKQNEKIYANEPDHPNYGRSVYDALIFTICRGGEDDPPDSLFCVIEVSNNERLMSIVEDL